MKRNYTAARTNGRCTAPIKLRDGSGARCMRKQVADSLCKQHHRIVYPLGKDAFERQRDPIEIACEAELTTLRAQLVEVTRERDDLLDVLKLANEGLAMLTKALEPKS